MGNSIKIKVLNSIGKIYDESKECKLEDSFFTNIDNDLSFLSEYFRTTKSQTFFIALVFTLNYTGNTVDLNDLTRYFKCNPMKILKYNDDFEYLYSKGIFERKKSQYAMKLAGTNDQFTINEKITEAILQNKPMPEIKQEKIEDVIGLLEKLYNIAEQRDDDEISTDQLFKQTKEIISENLHFPLIKKVDQFNYNIEDTYLYLYLIWKTLSGRRSTDIGKALEEIYDDPSNRLIFMQSILFKENVLVKNNLLEIIEARFFNDTRIKLTDNSLDVLNECGIKLFVNKKKKENILLPNEIPFRKLIFSESEMKQLFLLKDLLDDVKLRETQKRLIEKNLPKGITALLHGAPGTGKTEIVKQIAKETNRKLMKVEISQSKSMWFGESEKVIKQIFTDYNSFAKKCERMPILLFNEADAIISKRRELGDSSVAQTENAIQNILLEELENFEGILIATTNLAKNLDSAFERRFLFKVQFQKPNATIRTKIWKSKLPFLDIKDCFLLADKFNFSGGQIDNILRKNEIHEIIHGEKVNLENLMVFCSEETLVNNSRKIGFKN
ncbi:MAG: ATP-binding protein [Bacteroidota bacterium]|nr:ATP-binding protein [Bacteroidota bacterium]